MEKKRGKLDYKFIRRLAVMLVFCIVSITAALFIMYFDETSEEAYDTLLFLTDMVEYRLYEVGEYPEDINEWEEFYQSQRIPGENVDRWLREGKDELYDTASEHIRAMLADYGMDEVFVYKFTKGEDGRLINNAVVVLDTDIGAKPEYDLGYNLGASPYFETVQKVYETNEVQKLTDAERRKNGFGIAALAPVHYNDGTVCAVAGTKIKANTIALHVISENGMLTVIAAADILVFGIAILLFVRWKIVNPIGKISASMREFVSEEGSLAFRPVTDIHTNDEIEQIADDFNSLAARIIDYTHNLEEKTIVEERLRFDLDVSQQIRSTLSSEIRYPAFPERTDFDLCASMKHTIFNKCSFCNYFFTDTNRICIVVGESLGDNLASMIISITAVAYIKSFAKMGFEPQKIAFETNNQLCSAEKKDKGLTAGVVIADIDLKTGVMRYVNAGMPPVIIKKAGESFTPEKVNLPFSLGQMRGVTFEQNTIQLWQGNTVLFTSYGVSEMINPKGEKYTIQRLQDTVNRISSNLYELDKIIERLEQNLDNFRQDAPVTMDTAILGFRYFG